MPAYLRSNRPPSTWEYKWKCKINAAVTSINLVTKVMFTQNRITLASTRKTYWIGRYRCGFCNGAKLAVPL